MSNRTPRKATEEESAEQFVLLAWMAHHNGELGAIDQELGSALEILNTLAEELIEALIAGGGNAQASSVENPPDTLDPSNAERWSHVINQATGEIRGTYRQGTEELEGRLKALLAAVIGPETGR